MSRKSSSRKPNVRHLFFASAWKYFRQDGSALDSALVKAIIGARYGQRTYVEFLPDGRWRFYQCQAFMPHFNPLSVYVYVPACEDFARGPIRAGYLDRHPRQALAAIALMDAAAQYVIARIPGLDERIVTGATDDDLSAIRGALQAAYR